MKLGINPNKAVSIKNGILPQPDALVSDNRAGVEEVHLQNLQFLIWIKQEKRMFF